MVDKTTKPKEEVSHESKGHSHRHRDESSLSKTVLKREDLCLTTSKSGEPAPMGTKDIGPSISSQHEKEVRKVMALIVLTVKTQDKQHLVLPSTLRASVVLVVTEPRREPTVMVTKEAPAPPVESPCSPGGSET